MRYLLFILSFCLCTSLLSQERVLIDRAIAKVGTETILLSDVESQYGYATEQAGYADPEMKCNIIKSLIGQKLIVHQL